MPVEETESKKKKRRRSRKKKKNKTTEDGTTVQTASGNNETVADKTDTSPQTGRKKRRGGRRRLERCFGFFRCSNCKTQWTSAYTWRIRDTMKVVYKQQCQRCHQFWNPWKNDYLTCSLCGKKTPDCTCPRSRRRRRLKDSQKPHRSDLCEKCQSGRPCQTTGADEEYVPEK